MMKITTLFKSALFATVLLVNTAAQAYSPEELAVSCKKPHFTDFTLTPYVATNDNEVPAESEFSIKVSPWADPSTIKVTAKNQVLPAKVESNSSFHKITAKLPAEYSGGFARVNVFAKAVLGCDDSFGWLVKIGK